MKRNFLLIAVFVFTAALTFAQTQAPAARQQSPELQKLDVSVGRWIFHGKTFKSPSGEPGEWTWKENCRWSPNHLYLECTFNNVWSGRHVQSLVVDTYNFMDRSFWHFEMYAGGETGAHPFVSRMDINGNTWIEHGQEVVPGKKRGERIVYNWNPPDHVKVAIQSSTDGVHWTTVNEGEGVKQHKQQ